MYYLKITYDISTGKSVFIPADGKHHGVTQGLSALAKETGDGGFSVETLTWERDDPGDTAQKEQEIRMAHTVKVGEVCSGSYSVSDWSYLKGVSYRHPSYRAEVVDGRIALKESDDPVIKARVCVEMGDYAKADALLRPILPPDPNYYYFTNREANRLQAQRYELGLGVEKDLDRAYVHYLYAEAADDVVRLMDMGYGKGVLEEDYRAIDFCKYHFYKLIHAAGEVEYAEYRILWDAGCWLYEWHEKNSTDKDDMQKRRSYALCRRQACEWIIEKEDRDKALNGKLTLYLGAYLAYLEEGSEGKCTYVYENDGSKHGETSIYSAESYIERAVAAGNELAIRGKAFMDAVKEAKNE
ncbi:MAG: hypothetical protein IJX46_07890 [Clostridia bacterium]|nr:hypothetical protein [Clostridia bacterium]